MSHMSPLKSGLRAAATDSFNKYLRHGARSSKKVMPIHEYIRDNFISMGFTADVEKSVGGEFYSKKCDIVVNPEMSNSPEAEVAASAIVSVKFPLTNFKQNANNYFESGLGEVSNLRLGGVKVGTLSIVPWRLPYLNNKKKVTRIEYIADTHIDKLRKLMEKEHILRPDAMFFQFVDPWGDRMRTGRGIPKGRLRDMPFVEYFTDLGFSQENQEFLSTYSNYDDFLQRLVSDTK